VHQHSPIAAIFWMLQLRTRMSYLHHYDLCHTTCLVKSQVNTPDSGLLLHMSSDPLRKSTHFLYQYTSPLAMLPSVLFYKEGLYIFTQHSSKHWRGSPFTGLPHHHT
jgi:hypothetical protein